ncbi:MAG: DUF2892 domain-containing protein [Candidatus Micrarchaeota archaeon]|nr:DUF2892 domain-containing protein [Candidatus Micrarchaeota archaeon]
MGKENIGKADRAVRAVVGAVLGALVLLGSIAAPMSYLALVFALIVLYTAASGNCRLYSLLKLNTCGKKCAE